MPEKRNFNPIWIFVAGPIAIAFCLYQLFRAWAYYVIINPSRYRSNDVFLSAAPDDFKFAVPSWRF
jgi:hypothetical protein